MYWKTHTGLKLTCFSRHTSASPEAITAVRHMNPVCVRWGFFGGAGVVLCVSVCVCVCVCVLCESVYCVCVCVCDTHTHAHTHLTRA